MAGCGARKNNENNGNSNNSSNNSGRNPRNECGSYVACGHSFAFQELMDVPLSVPEHLTAFGPTVDGTVVPGEPRQEMASGHSSYADYDLLFGVVRFESYFLFTAHEEKHGFEVNNRCWLFCAVSQSAFTLSVTQNLVVNARGRTKFGGHCSLMKLPQFRCV